MSQQPDSRHGANPRVGVIADSPLQRHVVCRTVESVGYVLATSLAPEKVSDELVTGDGADVWLVDIEDEDKWSDLVVHLFEVSRAPILLGEGNAPSVTSLPFLRWERKIFAKLQDILGPPRPEDQSMARLVNEIPSACLAQDEDELPDQGPPATNVWVLGASLGGPEAVKEFFEVLPAGLPVAFVIAQHIDPGFHATLSKVWGRHSRFRFKTPRAGRCLSHGEAMIAPIEQVMAVSQFGRVELYEEPWEGPYAPSIDQLMSLMADRFGVQTGAILFSGMGNDGAIAASKLQQMGIEVWAQSAETCANSLQPDSARATGCVTFSGSPGELARRLVQYCAEQYPESIVN
ncbi:MAG: chemotaxis protein CheB [Pseudomonadales bacterium]|nr:chemotaxis protein CheB [Pseudomonadales bacterium]